MARDPTGTAKLRSRFRADTRRRIAELLALTTAVIVDHDLLGLRPFEHPLAHVLFPTGDRQGKLRAFNEWFGGAIYSVLLAGGGLWMLQHLEDAYVAGIMAAARQTAIGPIAPGMERFYLERAVRDLEGIADATVARATRVVADQLAARNFSASRMAREVTTAVRDIAPVRLAFLANTSTVSANNGGRLAQFRAAGVTQVGILPEKLPGLVTAGITAGLAAVALGRQLKREAKRRQVKIVTASDDRVCDECDKLAAGGPYDIDIAESLIPAHPNCRCAFVLVEDLEQARKTLRSMGIEPRI
jgi:hypothetical protein